MKKANVTKTVNTQDYNLFAILSLIFTFLIYPLGLIFAIVALRQIKKTGEKGKWLAWVSIGIGIFFLMLIIIGNLWVVLRDIHIA